MSYQQLLSLGLEDAQVGVRARLYKMSPLTGVFTKLSRLLQSYWPLAKLTCAHPVDVSHRRKPPYGTVTVEIKSALPTCKSM